MSALLIPVLLTSMLSAVPVSTQSTSLSLQKLDVQLDNGVITLRGAADTPEQKDFAGHLARNTGGVARVNNQITVAPR